MTVAGPRGPAWTRWLVAAVLIVFGLLMVAPIWWVIITAVAPRDKAFDLPPDWFPRHVEFGNVRRVTELMPIGRQAINSVLIASIVTLGALATSVLAAYAFARLSFRGKNVLFALFLAGLMVPPQSTVIPVFVLMRQLHLVDTRAAVFLPGLVSALGIFLLRQYIETIPRELDDSGRIDGLGHLGIIRHVILPLSGPVIVTLAIFLFQVSWNDFFWPSTVLQTADKMTLPVGLASLLSAQGDGDSTIIFAAVGMVVLPLLVLFLIFQRWLVQSIASTGLQA